MRSNFDGALDSDSASQGSNPCPPANENDQFTGVFAATDPAGGISEPAHFANNTNTAPRTSRHIPLLESSGEPLVLYLTSEYQKRAADRGLKVDCAYIYVIEAVGLSLFKIGLAADLRARFPAYRTECPVPCRPVAIAVVPKEGVQRIEQALHAHYAERRRKGEWFALTPEDIAGLEQSIKKASRGSINKLSRQVSSGGYFIYHPQNAEAWCRHEVEIARREAADSIPTAELIVDRIMYAGERREPIDARDLTRDIDRRPQDVHDALRYLLLSGQVAIVGPRRGPHGTIWFEDYRVVNLLITDITCEWETTTCGREIQVSEPLGDVVPEFFGRSRR